MTRYSRGTLLAVVGMREVPLCPACDQDVVSRVVERGQPIPDGYASRFLRGDVDPASPVDILTAPVRMPPPAPPTDAPTPVSAGRPDPVSDPESAPAARVGAPKPPPVPAKLQNPTVRQATEAFLRDAEGPADSLCLVLLGTELGASTRLTSLGQDTARLLATWVPATFKDAASARRASAERTIRDLVDHWLGEGWLETDIAAHLR
jgi:hypothetical protein